ncbi:hypothetical protein K458DRAFT_177917 [Lentithecium fluviatile CBS 122367]|uniref:Uncharacterized protein n=1 Tax=Lentithecium fluviatile CBS 122367 TaxID=1168545 RepID=A0A6G1IG23_9PLEO|nr:hypothetical protein K458DRAFT_177917 [Lentithecium fluviatile CBS 122367]
MAILALVAFPAYPLRSLGLPKTLFKRQKCDEKELANWDIGTAVLATMHGTGHYRDPAILHSIYDTRSKRRERTIPKTAFYSRNVSLCILPRVSSFDVRTREASMQTVRLPCTPFQLDSYACLGTSLVFNIPRPPPRAIATTRFHA